MLTLTLHHPALYCVVNILKKAHCHIEKLPLLIGVLTKPAHLAYRNPTTLHKLLPSKLNANFKNEA